MHRAALFVTTKTWTPHRYHWTRGRINKRACVLSCSDGVRLSATPWTVPTSLLCPWDSPGKNTGVDCHALHQDIFPTQGRNLRLLGLPHCRQILYHWAKTGSSIQCNLSQHEKGMCHRCTLDGSQGYCAEWGKPVSKGYIQMILFLQMAFWERAKL